MSIWLHIYTSTFRMSCKLICGCHAVEASACSVFASWTYIILSATSPNGLKFYIKPPIYYLNVIFWCSFFLKSTPNIYWNQPFLISFNGALKSFTHLFMVAQIYSNQPMAQVRLLFRGHLRTKSDNTLRTEECRINS